MLETVREEHPAAVKSALADIGEVWLGAFRQLLDMDARVEVESSWDSLGLRIEIYRVSLTPLRRLRANRCQKLTIQTLTTVQSSFPKLLTPHLHSYISTTLNNLTSLIPVFEKYYLSISPDAPEPPSPTSDAGFVIPKNDLDDLACAAFDFVTPLVRLPKVKEEMERGQGLAEGLVRCVLAYTQVTRSNVSLSAKQEGSVSRSLEAELHRRKNGWKMRMLSSRMTMMRLSNMDYGQ